MRAPFFAGLQEWRLDITLFVMLLAAFAAANALSLVAIAFVGLGMALQPRAKQVSVHMPAIDRLALVHCVATALPTQAWPCTCLP